MGGGGSYYDRDVRPSRSRGHGGYSDDAARATSQQTRLHADMNALGRRITVEVRSPLVYSFDVTGSMGSLPRILWDKMPMIIGQIIARGYLEEFQLCMAAIGDRDNDRVPVQIGTFDSPRAADEWMKKIYFEGGGGGNNVESYEMAAWYFANMVDMSKAETPFYLFTGDEGFFDTIPATEIRKHFDPDYSGETSVKSVDVFEQLIEKFGGNVFKIHRYYSSESSNNRSLEQWREALGPQRVIELPYEGRRHEAGDLAIGDITLGLFAVASGARSVDQYIEDMQTRPLDLAASEKFEPQSPERVDAVRRALDPLRDFVPGRVPAGEPHGRLDLIMDT